MSNCKQPIAKLHDARSEGLPRVLDDLNANSALLCRQCTIAKPQGASKMIMIMTTQEMQILSVVCNCAHLLDHRVQSLPGCFEYW